MKVAAVLVLALVGTAALAEAASSRRALRDSSAGADASVIISIGGINIPNPGGLNKDEIIKGLGDIAILKQAIKLLQSLLKDPSSAIDVQGAVNDPIGTLLQKLKDLIAKLADLTGLDTSAINQLLGSSEVTSSIAPVTGAVDCVKGSLPVDVSSVTSNPTGAVGDLTSNPTGAVSGLTSKVTGLTGGLPVVGGATGGLPDVGGVTQTVTGLTGNLPAVGSLTSGGGVGGVTGTVTGLTGNLPAVGSLTSGGGLSGVTNVAGSLTGGAGGLSGVTNVAGGLMGSGGLLGR